MENFREGQLEKQGLGTEELRRKHPHLIVAGHKGFLSGPYAHRPALDEVVQMMSGLAAMTGTREKPQRVGSSANDIMGGMFGAIAILAALYEKRGGKTGGADIRIGLFENCLFLVAQHMVEYEMTGRKPRSMPEREHAWPIYDIFDTADGERIFIGVVTEGHWWSFCREFGLQEFADDPTLRNTTDRILARGRIIPRVTEVIKGWKIADLSAKLDALNIAYSPINRPEDLLQDPHVLRPGGLVQNFNADGAPFRVPALPVEWNGGNIGEGSRCRCWAPTPKPFVLNSTSKPRLPKTTPHEAAMTRVQELYPDNKIVLREVGLRDGLQLVKKFPSTAAKQRWMRDEYAAGVRHFEVGSFLPERPFRNSPTCATSSAPWPRCPAPTASR